MHVADGLQVQQLPAKVTWNEAADADRMRTRIQLSFTMHIDFIIHSNRSAVILSPTTGLSVLDARSSAHSGFFSEFCSQSFSLLYRSFQSVRFGS